MELNYFVTFLIIFLILLYIFTNSNEKFIVCENTPTGPYSYHCILSKFYNNELSAFCKNVNSNDEFYSTKLNMNDCPNNDDCFSIGVNNDGKLTC